MCDFCENGKRVKAEFKGEGIMTGRNMIDSIFSGYCFSEDAFEVAHIEMEENMGKNIRDYINYIKREYGVYIDLDLIQDAFALSEYMTIKIMASTAGGEKEVNYIFQTTTVTENYLKKKIMEVVKMLKGDNMIFVDPSLGSFSGMITVPTTFSMDYRRQIKKVIFNDPATIIFWEDGSKTVVKCQPDDKYDKMTGFAMACAKYMFGNEGNYYEVFKKWVGEEE